MQPQQCEKAELKKQVQHSAKMNILARYAVVFFCLTSFYNYAQDAIPTKIHSNKRIYGGAVIPFYINNPDHTVETKGGFAFNIGFKRTFRIFDNSLETGIEYVNHEVSFRSYYFAPGYSKLYDKTFPFLHDLKINELQLPIIFKQTFGKETKNQATSYFTVFR